MKLYFDIGNTNIKLNFMIDGQEYYNSYETKYPYTVDSLYGLLPSEVQGATIESAIICSVVPNLTSIVEGMVKKYWQIKPKQLKIPIKTGIKIKANDPKKVGADIVALAAFIASETSNGIIVNMGTATTITHVVNNTIEGVIIIPGLKISLNALLNNAKKLTDITVYLPKNKVMGNSTEEAVSIGIIKGHTHMIREFINEIDKDADVFISGGHSRLISKTFVGPSYVKEATIMGMKIIEALNE